MHPTGKGLVICGAIICLGITLATSVRSEVVGVPTSDELVIGTLHLKNGVWAGFRAREGSMVTAQESGQSAFIGFVPQLTGEHQESVRIVPFKITKLKEEKQRADEILDEARILEKGSSTEFDPSGFGFRITFSDITQGEFLSPVVEDPNSLTPEELKALFGLKSGDYCCLTCSGITVCADGVTMSCGSCFAGGGGGRMPV